MLLAIVLLCGFCASALAQSLRPGDVISISVYQDPKLDRQIRIGPTGLISFPLAGQLRAGGLSPASLENALRARLRDKFAGDLDITVSLVQPQEVEDDLKPRIFVTGEVLKPGPFVLRLRTNVVQAIALAGGFAPFAAKRRIQVRRQVNGVEEIIPFDYEAFFHGVDASGNVNLRPGDVVIVPEKGLLE
jgi:polysaccharide export outer membrane protein